MPRNISKERSFSYLEGEWIALQESVDLELRLKLHNMISKESEILSSMFYKRLRSDAQADFYLSDEIIRDRLLYALKQWITDLFPREEAPDFLIMSNRQLAVGKIHSRISLPLEEVFRAWRILHTGLTECIFRNFSTHPDAIDIINFVSNTLNIAIEIMSMSFSKENGRAERNEEAYRLFSLGQNLPQERESQRAAIAEWMQRVLFLVASRNSNEAIPDLGTSDFGLWLTHRGKLVFEGMSEINTIFSIMKNIDEELIPNIFNDMDNQSKLVSLQSAVNDIRVRLGGCFDIASRIESGRDSLTRLLNRRFMETVLSREVAFSRQMLKNLSIAMIDIDNFKIINDTYGHSNGDIVLRKISEIVLDTARIGDFVFRYGGEELLVVLVETIGSDALSFSERLRCEIENSAFKIDSDAMINVTVSIGVAEFSGHPDYMELIKMADSALYRAKSSGRNQVCMAI